MPKPPKERYLGSVVDNGLTGRRIKNLVGVWRVDGLLDHGRGEPIILYYCRRRIAERSLNIQATTSKV
jgi:hypothetical protein